MTKERSDRKVDKKWKSYFTGFITSNFMAYNRIDKYFRTPISESTCKAIQENWIRILGIDYEIISMNLCKESKPLGIALEGRNQVSRSGQEVIQRHYLKAIIPEFCIGLTNKFTIKDELLEVNGLKIFGMSTKDVVNSLKKLTNYFQIVVARSVHDKYELASDYGGSEDNINSPISFYDMDDEDSSQHGTLRSTTSNYSTTSRDFGSSVSFGGLIDGQYENVREYLKNMIGWRGPLVIEFRKQKERLGLALEEIEDPLSSNFIIVFKIIIADMKAGQDGRLHVGDRLLQVNGKSIVGIPFKKVCQWMKSAPGGRLVLCICKPHFEQTNFDHATMSHEDKFNTLINTDKLPKLSEETDGDSFEIPAAPEYLENHLTLKRVEERLGIFLDVVDNGRNGSRIKKITRGITKDDGTLREGDFVTSINEISLRVDDKVKLNNNLKRIAATTGDYNICYITAEDLHLYKTNYQRPAPITSLYPDPTSVKSEDVSTGETLTKNKPSKLAFLTFEAIIVNDHQTGLGLVIAPSLKEPSRYNSIIDIHQDSLVDKSGLLKINDDILMVNDTSFENLSNKDAANFLRNAIQNEDSLHFKVRRLTNSDDHGALESTKADAVYRKVAMLPDIYCCSIKKRSTGYGFTILDSENGVCVEKIEPNSAAHKVEAFKSGDRFVMINNINVINNAKESVMQIVKNSTNKLQLVMESPKFIEFVVRITKDSSAALGLNVGGGADTRFPIPVIESLVPNRSSKFSEEICPRDYIIEVNDIKMADKTHSEVIQILRAAGVDSNFKLCRQLPYFKRELFADFESPEFPYPYLQSCQYSVSISKPVDTIATFGISFIDVVILDPSNHFRVVCRYKAVKGIEKNSLAEKYAPQISPFDYLISVNQVPIDCDILCEDLKEIIDTGSRVSFVLSKDIPYNLDTDVNEYDSQVLLSNDDLKISHSDTSSEAAVSLIGVHSHHEDPPNTATLDNTTVPEPVLITDSEKNDDLVKAGDNCDIVDSEPRKVENDETPNTSNEMDDKEDSVDKTLEDSTPKPDETPNTSDDSADKTLEDSTPEPDETEHSDTDAISKLGLNIDHVLVPILENMELGFHVYGGLDGGPNGETLPVFVIGVEKNTCNWPADREEPYLKNGQHLLELNDTVLSAVKLSKVEKMIKETEGELNFKVVTFK